MEHLLACIKIEENSVFKLFGGLIDDWKEEAEKSMASCLSNSHEGGKHKTNLKAKTLTS